MLDLFFESFNGCFVSLSLPDLLPLSEFSFEVSDLPPALLTLLEQFDAVLIIGVPASTLLAVVVVVVVVVVVDVLVVKLVACVAKVRLPNEMRGISCVCDGFR